jgi:hypothetical protein
MDRVECIGHLARLRERSRSQPRERVFSAVAKGYVLNKVRSIMNLHTPSRFLLLLTIVTASNTLADLQAGETAACQLQINVSDSAGDPLPCRVHLSNSKDEPQKAHGQPFWNDHFVCAGRVAVDLVPGVYRYEIQRGPEYRRESGTVEVGDAPAELNLTLSRIANLRESGWYCGDLHVHRPIDQVELLMRAEDLDIAPVISWWNTRNAWQGIALPQQTTRQFDGHRIYNVMAGEDEREGGALLYFGLHKPLDITAVNREVPSPMQFVTAARKLDPKVWIDIEKPFWWDVPVWLASGQMQSIGIANNHMCRSRMLANEAWGKSRDERRLPPPRGNGFWTQEIYYHMLNCGIAIPPSAGSASGVLPNPVGYNRVYVHLEDSVPFTRASWYDALSRGNSFVTNGPLLVAEADGRIPGSRISIGSAQQQRIKVEVRLTSLDPVSKIEVILNGAIVATADCDDQISQQCTIEFDVDGAGWFLVRAIAEVDETFRFASTAPWFVATESGDSRISKTSAQFFLDWTRERIGRVQAGVTDPNRLREVLHPHQQAEAFWLSKVSGANAP